MQLIRSSLVSLFLIILRNSFLTGQEVTVRVYPEIGRQTITSIGANYCQTRYSHNAWDAIGEETLKQFRPAHVRVALPLRIRRTSYEQMKGNKIIEQPLVISLMEFMKRMKVEFGVKNFIVSVWDLPDDLISNPSQRAQRKIKPESYDEVIDMILAFLVETKTKYGVEADYFSFNESDGGWQIQFTPSETIEFIKKAGQRFSKAGLKTQFLLADAAQTKGTVEFATQIMADSSIWQYLGPLAFHCWWSEDIPDQVFERVAALGKALNKPVWCTETGFDAHAYKIEGMFQSWDFALRYARIFYRMVRYAEAEVSLYWTWQNDYPIMSADLKSYYPSFYVTRHHTEFLNAGTKIFYATSDDPEILPLAGIHPDGSTVLHLINMKKQAVSVSFSGLNPGMADMVSTTLNNLWEEKKGFTKIENGILKISLEGESVNTLIIRK